MTTTKQYYAFISYKRDDQKWAEWLQEKLEHYKLPSNLNGKDNLPKEIRPVFRDKSELAAGVLADEIQKALDNSKYLIVICSPHSAKSEWVNKEVQSFIDSGRTDKIIPFIIEGTPNSNNEETECFPKAIRELPAEDELLGVNINEMGRDAAAVKVVAQMFGLRFDDLWQRHEREKRRRRNWIITASVAAFLVMVGIAGWIWHQNVMLKQKDWKMMESQSRVVSKEVIANAQKDSYLAKLVALNILPKNVSKPIDRPYTAEAEHALRKACEYNSAILRGHNNNIYSASYDFNGERLLSVSGDNTIKIWDVKSGENTMTINNISSYNFNSANFSPDGKHIISAAWDSVMMWNAESGELIWAIKEKEPCGIQYAPNGKYIVYANDSTLKVINPETTDVLLTIPVNRYNSINFDISPDSKKIVCAKSVEMKYFYLFTGEYGTSDEDTIQYTSNVFTVFDAKTGDVISSWNGHMHTITSVVFSPDGKYVASASWDRNIYVWNAENGKIIQKMKWENNSYVSSISFSPSGKEIVSAHVSGYIKIWDVETGMEKKSWNGHKSYATSVAYSNDGKNIVSASIDGTIKIWDLGLDDIVWLQLDNDVSYAFIGFDRKTIAYNINDSTYCVFDIEKGDKRCYLQINDFVDGVIFSPDGKYAVLMPDSDTNVVLNVFDTNTGDVVSSLKGHDGWAHFVTFTPDSQLVISSAWDGTVRFWDVITGTEIRRFDKGSVNSFHYNHDMKQIAVVPYDDNKIIMLDAQTFERIGVLEGHNTYIIRAFFSNDGKYIVSSDRSGMTKLWDSQTGQLLHNIEGYLFLDNNYNFSPNGKYLMTMTNQNEYNIYDISTGGCAYNIQINDTIISALFTENGEGIMTVLSNGTIRQYDFPPLQELIDSTRERFKNRPLTDEERKMYYLE